MTTKRRRAMAANICFDFVCPHCRRVYKDGHVGYVVVYQQPGHQAVTTDLCARCAEAIARAVES